MGNRLGKGASFSRRAFVGGSALTGIAALGSLAGCGAAPRSSSSDKTSTTAAKDWLGEAPAIADSDIVKTLSTDMLIIGAGNAGLSAAATAADKGADFIICDKSAAVGPARHWIGAVNTGYTKALGFEVDTRKLLNEAARYASNKCKPEVINTWITESADTIAWLDPIMAAQGQVCVVDPSVAGEMTGGTSFYVPVLQHTYVPNDNPTGFGADRNEILEKYIGDRGYNVSFGYELVSLIREENARVSGAIFKASDGYVKIKAAKGILLATGGYAANSDMVKALSPIIPACTTSASYMPTTNGTGIKAALWVGAERDIEAAPMIFDRGTCTPDDACGYIEANGEASFPVRAPDSLLNFIGSQPFMKISRAGTRFANESTPYDFICFAASEQPGGVWAQIFDANVKEDILKFATVGCSKIIQGMVAQPAPFEEIFASLFDEGMLFKANTLDELADKLKLSAEAKSAFLKEVGRYNSFADAGVDSDFGKEAYRLSSIRKAPFYGVWSGGTLLTTLDGVKINKDMQVLDKDKNIIEGLYAAGDCSGSFFSGNYPEYLIGIACGRTITFGRHAAKRILS
jgi:fumarate reductase flavoprotein subunit